MDMRRLEIFYRVVEEGGFTRAAEALSLTQPTLSAAVAQLEEELNVCLLERRGRGIRPTDAGRLLHSYAGRIFALRREAETELEALKIGGGGELRLGAGTIPGSYLLPRPLARFRAEYPQIRVQLQLASSGKVLEELRARHIELALVGCEIDEKRFEAFPCGGDDLVLVVPAGHPWAGRQEVEARELAGCSLLLREPASATRRALEERLQQQRVQLPATAILAEVPGNEPLKQGVLAGLGLAVISRLAVAGELARGELHALELSGGPLRRTFYLVHERGGRLSVAAGLFREGLLGAVKD